MAQKHTTPVHTGLIFSLEPVFTALSAILFLNEVLSVKGYLGGLIMVVSVILVEIDFSALRKNRGRPAQTE